MWLIPKGLGIAGEIGVIALDVIVAGLIGGVFLVFLLELRLVKET